MRRGARAAAGNLPNPVCGVLSLHPGFLTCEQCAPALRRRLKAEARGEAARVREEHPEPEE